MPNYCNNTLEVSADPKNREALKQLKDFVDNSIREDGEKFTFEGVLPMPKELDITSPTREEDKAQAEANIKNHGHADWYNWRVDNWGTKWDVGECYISDIVKDYVHLDFDTAWSPPLPYYKALSKKYPLLTIEVEYSEPGMDFAGIEKYQGGELMESEEYTHGVYQWIHDREGWWENMEHNFEEGDWMKYLSDFKEHCADIWAMMNKGDKAELKVLIEQCQSV